MLKFKSTMSVEFYSKNISNKFDYFFIYASFKKTTKHIFKLLVRLKV